MFYTLIFVCLLSVSTTVMDAAIYLPNRVTAVMKNGQIDEIALNEIKIDELKTVSQKFNLQFVETISLLNANLEICNDNEKVDVVMPKDFLPSNSFEFIENNIITGSPVSQSDEEGLFLWASDAFAQNYDIECGSKVTLTDFEGNANDVEVCGIYTADETNDNTICDCYISLGAYKTIKQDPYIIVRPERFKDIFKLISYLQDEQISISYAKDVVDSIRMLYITFFSINIILIISLSGILLHLLSIYFEQQSVFYATNSALGMSNRDIVRIVFIISEILLSVTLLISCFTSVFMLNKINQYAGELFVLPTKSYLPIIPMLANFVLLQICLFFVIRNFRKSLENKEIVQILHYE